MSNGGFRSVFKPGYFLSGFVTIVAFSYIEIRMKAIIGHGIGAADHMADAAKAVIACSGGVAGDSRGIFSGRFAAWFCSGFSSRLCSRFSSGLSSGLSCGFCSWLSRGLSCGLCSRLSCRLYRSTRVASRRRAHYQRVRFVHLTE